MKAVIFLLSIFTTCLLAYPDVDQTENNYDLYALYGIEPRVYEAQIINKTKELLLMLNGTHEYISLDMSLLGDNLKMQGNMTNSTVTGTDEANVDDVSFNPISLEFKIHVGLNETKAVGDYFIDVLLAQIVPIYGYGKFDVSISGASVRVYLKLAPVNGTLHISTFSLEASITSCKMDMGDHFMGGPMGDIIGNIIEENLPNMLDRFMFYYGETLEAFVKQIGNKCLAGITVNDIIKWINGNGEISLTC